METLRYAEESLLKKRQEARDIDYEALLKDDSVADVIMYGMPTRESKIRQMDAFVTVQQKISNRVDRAHVMLVSANVLTMAVMSSQLSMHRWRVTEAQTLSEATSLLQEQVTRAKNSGYHVKCDPPSAFSATMPLGAASGDAPAGKHKSEHCAWEAAGGEPPVAETAATEAGGLDSERMSSCSSVCSAEFEEEQQKPAPNDMIPRLVIVDVFTHEPFLVTLEHLRYLDREHGLNLIVVLMLYESYNGRAPGIVVLPNHTTTTEEAYEMGFDLVIRRIFDHKVVNFLSDTFMSATGRWRNDVRRRAAVGNYRTMQDLLFGPGNIKGDFAGDKRGISPLKEPAEFDTDPHESFSQTQGMKRNKNTSKNSLSASLLEPLSGVLNNFFNPEAGDDEKGNIALFSVARDATGGLMSPSSAVKFAVQRRFFDDKEENEISYGDDEEESYEDILVDEADELESARVVEYRREITRLVEEVEQGRRYIALLKQELSQQVDLYSASLNDRRSARCGGSTLGSSQLGIDESFNTLDTSASIPVTLTKEQQIHTLKMRLAEATERLTEFTDPPEKGRRKSQKAQWRVRGSNGRLSGIRKSPMGRTMSPNMGSPPDFKETQRSVEAIERELMAQHDYDAQPLTDGRSNRQKKKGNKKRETDYNQATDDIISSLTKEILILKEQMERMNESTLVKSTRLTTRDLKRIDEESRAMSRLEGRLFDAMELIKGQRKHIQLLEEQLGENWKNSKEGKKTQKDVEAFLSRKVNSRIEKSGTGLQSPTAKKTLTMQQQQQKKQATPKNGNAGEAAKSERPISKSPSGLESGILSTPRAQRRDVTRMYEAHLIELRSQMRRQEKKLMEEEGGHAESGSPEEATRTKETQDILDVQRELQRAYEQLRSPCNTEKYSEVKAEHERAVVKAKESLEKLRLLFENDNMHTSNANADGRGVDGNILAQVWEVARDYAMAQRAADEVASRLHGLESSNVCAGGNGGAALEQLREDRCSLLLRSVARLASGEDNGALAVEVLRLHAIEEELQRWPPLSSPDIPALPQQQKRQLKAVEKGDGTPSRAVVSEQRSTETVTGDAVYKGTQQLLVEQNSHVTLLNDLYIHHHDVLFRLLRLIGKQNSAIRYETAEHESFFAHDMDSITIGSLIPADTALLYRLVELIERSVAMVQERDKLAAEEEHAAHSHQHRHRDNDTEGSHWDAGRSDERQRRRLGIDDFTNARPSGTDAGLPLSESIAQMMSRANIDQGEGVMRCLEELLHSLTSDNAAGNRRPSSGVLRDVHRVFARLKAEREENRAETVGNAHKAMARRARKRGILPHDKTSNPPGSHSDSESRSHGSNDDTSEGSDGVESETGTLPPDARRHVLSSLHYRCNVPPEKRHAVLRRHRGEEQVTMIADFGGDVSTEVSSRVVYGDKKGFYSSKDISPEMAWALDRSKPLPLPPLLRRGLTRAQQRQQSVFAVLQPDSTPPRDLSHARAFGHVAQHPMDGSPFTAAELAERIMAYRLALSRPDGLGTEIATRVQPSFFIPVGARSLPVDAEGSRTAPVATAVLSEEYTSWVYGVPAAQLEPMMRGSGQEGLDTVLFLPACASAGPRATGDTGVATFVGRMLARLRALGTPAASAAQRLNERLRESMEQTSAWPLTVIGRSLARSEARHSTDRRAQPQSQQQQGDNSKQEGEGKV